MGRPKGGAAASSSSKKPKAKPKQRGGVDFKKYKHKVGRKLPPPKNATNTEIKSKSIVLPEQSMASERTGMAVNKRGLTLRELLQQTGHYNANVRRAALNGIKDLVVKHPSELKLHKVAIVEKLQERICDNDKVVRESLFSILQSFVFPSLKEDNAISTRSTLFLLMANILNGMTHLSMDIQLMSFRFLELVVINFPSSFPRYAEQVFNNFLAVLSNDRIHLQDKSKLNSVLNGLGHCLSQVAFATENGDASNRLVHNVSGRELWKCTLDEDNSGSRAFAMSNILTKLQNLIQILVNSVEVSASELFAKSTIDAQSSEALLSALHCLDLICKICIQEVKKPQMKFGRSETQFGPEWLKSSLLVYLKKLWGVNRSFHEKGDDRYYVFNLKIAEIFLCLSACMDDSMFPAEEFCQFVSSLLSKVKALRNKDIMEKHLSPLIISIPDLVSNAPDDSKGYLLEAFTDAFRDCKVDCKLILPYLDSVGKLLLPEKTGILFTENDSGLEYHGVWVDELPGILLQSIDKAPSVTKVVLELLLRIGQYFPTIECGNMHSFVKLFGVKCDVLEPTILFRVVEVLQSTYKAGNLHITEQLSFLSLLMARFRVHPGPFCTQEDSQTSSNLITFKSLNHLILTSLSDMGDGSLAQIPSLHNMNGLFRIIVTLDAGTCKLMNEDVIKIIAGYLIDAAMDLSKTIELGFQSDKTRVFQYFIKPCIIIFCQNEKVLCCTLEMLKSFATGDDNVLSSVAKLKCPDLSHRICLVTTIIVFLCNDCKLHKNLSLGKSAIKAILQHTRHLMDSNVPDVTYEDKQKLRFAFEQLKSKALQLNCWDKSELENFSSATKCDV
uniref:Pre-rRNA-processing protein Ipi1 N-terminal domain-containing protein n=2 Tax=Leersia perrieri TaxID=77586 RepID=A0A0D9W601_9ORYZ